MVLEHPNIQTAEISTPKVRRPPRRRAPPSTPHVTDARALLNSHEAPFALPAGYAVRASPRGAGVIRSEVFNVSAIARTSRQENPDSGRGQAPRCKGKGSISGERGWVAQGGGGGGPTESRCPRRRARAPRCRLCHHCGGTWRGGRRSGATATRRPREVQGRGAGGQREPASSYRRSVYG